MLLKKKEINPLDKKVVDNLRGLSIDMIDNAKSGHPGICLGAAPIIYCLYSNFLRFDISNPSWIARDRFVLSSGHGSALLYSVLHMAGFDLSLEDLKRFRSIDSKTPGHPELGLTPGVDISTGPLGQGIANAVGMAIAGKYLNSLFKSDVMDYTVYALCGDGDLMEGISYEACSLAGNLKLDNLIILYDSNDITLDGNLKDTFSEDIKKRFESIKWNHLYVADSEDLNSINDAIKEAKNSNLPTIIEIKTTIGKYSKNEGTNVVHGKPLDTDDVTNIKQKLGLRDIPFQLSVDALTYFRNVVKERTEDEISMWMKKMSAIDELDKQNFDLLQSSNLTINIKNLFINTLDNNMESIRMTSGKIIDMIKSEYPFIIGGSCDVKSSTFVDLKERNISFGVREHAAAGIANGIASIGLTPIVSTFLSFSDYMKPSIRMSAMMNLPVIYVFTHDSITVGEDGPTHQPIEQLVSLRSIPNLHVYRPCDVNELLGTYKNILKTRKPSAIILTRNKLKVLSNTNVNDVSNGAYIIKKETKQLTGIIISTGEEVHLSLDVATHLNEKGLDFRVVSMPSIEIFNSMPEEYKNEIIPSTEKTFVIEASSSYSWFQFVNNKNHLFTIDEFGCSGSSTDVLEKYKFTEKYIEEKIEELIK